MKNYLKRNWILIGLVIVSSVFTILFNFYSIKITSGTRSYLAGESRYSKGQKDAVRHLLKYLEFGTEDEWTLYRENIDIPLGAGDLRIAMLNDRPKEVLYAALARGKNNPLDYDKIIWMYKNFNSLPDMKEANKLWESGDIIIRNLDSVAKLSHEYISTGNKDKLDLWATKNQLIDYNDQLSIFEYAFAHKLAGIGRTVEKIINIVNVFFVIIIVGGLGFYFLRLINRLTISENLLIKKNTDLQLANMELDKFVYSVSHDLRSPITTMKGLIYLMKDDQAKENHEAYMEMIDTSLNRQDSFIRKILNYLKNKRVDLQLEKVNFSDLVTGIIEDLRLSENGQQIDFITKIEKPNFITDESKLSFIIRNLVSNAIKFSDKEKDSYIKISNEVIGDSIIIEVEDNGIGIEDTYIKKIFEMFFIGKNSDDGSGIGLYIVKEAVGHLSGTIEVNSIYGEMTIFKITLPFIKKI